MKPAPIAVALLCAGLVAACGDEDASTPFPGVYELVSAGGMAPPILISDEGGIRMYLDSMYVEFAEDTSAVDADGIYAGRWRVEHRHAHNDSTYFVAHADGNGTWSYTSDSDLLLRYANGGLRTRGTRDGRELYMRQFFSFDVEDWQFIRTDRGPELLQ